MKTYFFGHIYLNRSEISLVGKLIHLRNQQQASVMNQREGSSNGMGSKISARQRGWAERLLPQVRLTIWKTMEERDFSVKLAAVRNKT